MRQRVCLQSVIFMIKGKYHRHMNIFFLWLPVMPSKSVNWIWMPHLLLLILVLLPYDPIAYQKNGNDISSTIVSKTIPLGTIKTVLALTSSWGGSRKPTLIDKDMRILHGTLGLFLLAHVQNYVFCYNVHYEAGVSHKSLIFLAASFTVTLLLNFARCSYSQHAFRFS